MYAHTPVRSCTAKIKKKNFPFSEKNFFFIVNRNDWYIFRAILVSLCYLFLILLLFHNSEGVNGLFFR